MLVTSLLALTLAAPVPKEKPAVLYFPSTAGAKWMLRTTYNGNSSRPTPYIVTKVEEKDGVRLVTVTQGTEPDSPEGRYEVSAQGVWVWRSGGKDPEPHLKVGAKPGTTWEVERKASNGKTLKQLYTSGGEEEVEVPAGKFKALRVDCEWDFGAGPRKASFWYVAGMGLVKYLEDRRDQGTWVQEMTEFTTPNDEPKK